MQKTAKERINDYSARLPRLKEKLMTMVVLLLVAFTMLTTVSFAWVALSINPEVSNISTAIASNGNLEIALATSTTAPGDTQIGDSGLPLLQRNNTWGNLINLSDPAYGLDKIVLRPATLNAVDVINYPLTAGVYDESGRKIDTMSNFTYTVWNPDAVTMSGKGGFEPAKNGQLGVRAISTVNADYGDAYNKFLAQRSTVQAANDAAGSIYSNLANTSAYMQSLATMMGLYMTARMNPSNDTLKNPACAIADIKNINALYKGFINAFEEEADAMVALVRFQYYALGKTDDTMPDIAKDTNLTQEIILNGTGAYKANSGNDYVAANGKVKITDIKSFQADYKTICSDQKKLQALEDAGVDVKWSDSGLNAIVNNLVDVGKCTIGANNTPISSIGASNATQYLSGTQEAKITNGILYRFEHRTGKYIEVKNLSISATVERYGITIPATVKANIQTTAPRTEVLFYNDMSIAEFTGSIEQANIVAKDTYGMAVDFWVRTNAEGSYLMLEGNVLIKEEEKPVMGTDADGNEVELYSVWVPAGDGSSELVETSILLYKDGSTYYRDGTSEEYTFGEGEEARKKIEIIETVIGYDGENRVWDGTAGLSIDATTQGSGSCYVFYTDTPEDQSRSLKLLQYMRVAFIDGEGTLLATAAMDTEHFYSDSGRVIVPLTLGANSIYLGDDLDGDPMRAITSLEKNVATRISAIIYLDGEHLTNDDVLAAADIQGQLNIQFGSSADLDHVDNEELRNKVMTVNAEVTNTSFEYNPAANHTSYVNVNIVGDKPGRVEAFFIRQINATQGSREEKFALAFDEASGQWKGSYTFTSPGTYILRSIQVDGIEKNLSIAEGGEFPTVVVRGFALTELGWSGAGNKITVYKTENTHTESVWLKFSTDDLVAPTSVEGRFEREEGGEVASISFVYNPTRAQWEGSTRFLLSGTYVLRYLVVNGEYQEIPIGMQKQAHLYLGLNVVVETSESTTDFKYDKTEMEEAGLDKLSMRVKILDNTDNLVKEIYDKITLTYVLRTSTAKTMYTELRWNSGTEYYEGEFNAWTGTGGAGIYEFASLTIDDDSIYSARSAPVFFLRNDNLPEMTLENMISSRGANNLSRFVTDDDELFLLVDIDHSETADVWAVIKHTFADGTSHTHEIKGVQYSVNALDESEESQATRWKFVIPVSEDETRDGTWQITEIRIWDYYNNKGELVTKDNDGNPLVFEPVNFKATEDGELLNIYTIVTSDVTLEFVEDYSKDFGKDSNGNVTGLFMDSYNKDDLGTLKLKVSAMGAAVDQLATITMKFKYNGETSVYGGYTSTSVSNSLSSYAITAILTKDGTDGTMYTLSSIDKDFQMAGTYTLESISFMIGSKTFEYGGTSGKALPANAPMFSVYSQTPTLSIDSISPEGEHQSVNASDQNITATSGISGNTITLYPWASVEGSGCNRTGKMHGETLVRLKFTGLGNANNATLTFTPTTGNEVLLYSGTSSKNGTQTDSFIWDSTTGEVVQRFVGYNDAGSCDSSRTAGTIVSGNSITMVYNDGTKDIEFSVAVSPITIINNKQE